MVQVYKQALTFITCSLTSKKTFLVVEKWKMSDV